MSKVVYVCSRYKANDEETFEKQLAWTKEVAREVVLSGYEVIVPHLMYTQFLDDDVVEERVAGMESALRLLRVCDVLLVSIKDFVSKGMEAEIEEARRLGKQILYFRNKNELRDILKAMEN